VLAVLIFVATFAVVRFTKLGLLMAPPRSCATWRAASACPPSASIASRSAWVLASRDWPAWC